jgi:type I restriction enzyme S subunit
MGWREVRIGSLGRVVTGKTPPSARRELFGDAHPFITPTDIDGVSRTVATERFIADAGAAAFKNQMIPAGAVCFVCIGATIGKMCIATRRSLTNQQVNSIVVDEALHDPKYVFYALRQIAPDVKGLAGGAATPIISKSSFSDISIRVPPLWQQRRIAFILSTYDDLIEINTRRIAILGRWPGASLMSGSSASASPATRPCGWSNPSWDWCRRGGS